MEDTVNSTTSKGFCVRFGISCSYSFSPFLVGLIIVNIALCAVLALVAVLGNGLVFAAYYYSESLRRPAHILLLSLAATDLLSGLVAQPAFIVKNCLLITGCHRAICTVQQLEWLAMVSLTGATMLNLSMITVDRYIAICHPFKYEELVTNARVKRAVCLLWFVWTVSALAWSNFFPVRQPILFIIVITLNTATVAFLYVKMYVEIRRVASNQETVGTTEEEQKAQRKKSATTLGYIFGLLFCCFVPAIVYVILRRSRVIVKYEYKLPCLLLSTNAAFSNSPLNVLVYYWRNEEMREAMRKVLRKVRQKFENEVNP